MKTIHRNQLRKNTAKWHRNVPTIHHIDALSFHSLPYVIWPLLAVGIVGEPVGVEVGEASCLNVATIEMFTTYRAAVPALSKSMHLYLSRKHLRAR